VRRTYAIPDALLRKAKAVADARGCSAEDLIVQPIEKGCNFRLFVRAGLGTLTATGLISMICLPDVKCGEISGA
jgi:hypothetical protein